MQEVIGFLDLLEKRRPNRLNSASTQFPNRQNKLEG